LVLYSIYEFWESLSSSKSRDHFLFELPKESEKKWPFLRNDESSGIFRHYPGTKLCLSCRFEAIAAFGTLQRAHFQVGRM